MKRLTGLMTKLKKLKNELWELCKKLTRKIHGNHCYTCGVYVRYPHTGHYITKSTCSTELAYDLKNLRPQCYVCNIFKSGNWVIFEANLIRDHGKMYISDLKKRNFDTKGLMYRDDWYIKKITEYKALLANESYAHHY